jgi:hypothetical protein
MTAYSVLEAFFSFTSEEVAMIRDAAIHSPTTLTNRLHGPPFHGPPFHGPPFQLPVNKRLIDIPIEPSILELVPESVARENGVLPVAREGETIVFATASHADVMVQDKLRFLLNCNVRFVSRDRDDVREAINFFYGTLEGESCDSMLQEFTDTAIFCESDGDVSACDFPAATGRHHQAVPLDRQIRASAPTWRRRQRPTTDYEGNGLMFYTIPEGKRVLAHRPNGKIDVLAGPRRVWKGRTRFEPMCHHVAHPAQYLSIRFRDGREEIAVGPAERWLDPREHESIEIHECLDLAAKEAVVVYGAAGGEETGTSRRIFYGPGLFAPRPGEWLHRFSWHASHGGSRGAEKRPNALQFQKLCLMPDQMYHDVRDVRTSDDAVLTIRLMIFFELIDIDRMLETTHDPIGDFINAATSDVVEFTGKRSFEDFKQQTELLNEIATYGQLLHRAQQCGYKINNVVYRGYGAPDSLQAMHDEAIQTRTRLQLEKATEKQAQEVEDYRLSCQMERAARRRSEQMAEVEHDLEMKRQQSEAGLKQKERQSAFTREQRRAQEELELELRQRSDEQTRQHLQSLSEMQVNLTEYLTQSRADQVIEVRGSDATMKPDIHLGNGRRKTPAPR